MYSTDLTSTNVYAINEKTFAETLVGQTSFPSAAAGQSLQDGKIYYVSYADSNGRVSLGSFAPSTGTDGPVLQITGLQAVDSAPNTIFVRAGFNAAGNLYIQSDASTNLYQLNPSTGAATLIGSLTGISKSFGDLAFDPTNPDLFYLVVGYTGGDATLYQVRLSTLAAVAIGNLGLGSKEQIFGLAFGNDGNLYAGDGAGALYRLNPQTAAATPVAALAPIYDLASLPQTIGVKATLAKVHAGALVAPGGKLTYTITLGNAGSTNNCSLTSLTLSDVLPSSLSNPTFSPSTGTYAASTGAWTGLSLGPNQSVVLTVTATVDANASGTITNTANVVFPDGINDTGATTASDTANVATAGLTVRKTGTAQAAPGGLIAYTVTVSNAGPQAGDGTVFRDPLPSGLALTGTPTCTASGGAVCGGVTSAGGVVASTITTLPANGSVSFGITATTPTAATYTNVASVTAPSTVGDPNPTTSSFATTVAAAYGVVKTVADLTHPSAATQGNDDGLPGDELQYALTYTNTTGQPLSNFVFKDVVPANTTYVQRSAACTVPASGCTVTPTVAGSGATTGFAWSLPSLAPNATFTVRFQVTID